MCAALMCAASSVVVSVESPCASSSCPGGGMHGCCIVVLGSCSGSSRAGSFPPHRVPCRCVLLHWSLCAWGRSSLGGRAHGVVRAGSWWVGLWCTRGRGEGATHVLGSALKPVIPGLGADPSSREREGEHARRGRTAMGCVGHANAVCICMPCLHRKGGSRDRGHANGSWHVEKEDFPCQTNPLAAPNARKAAA
jgi:hypothetical protein